MLEDFINLRNKYIGYNLGNKEQYLVCKEKRFPFSIHEIFYIWDANNKLLGSYNLGKNYKDKIPTKEFVEWIKNILCNYINGIINCSDCGKQILIKDIAGRYFAGVYCKDCWEKTWKAIEAKENYD